jgi:hypothetical protein
VVAIAHLQHGLISSRDFVGMRLQGRGPGRRRRLNLGRSIGRRATQTGTQPFAQTGQETVNSWVHGVRLILIF